MSQGLFAKLLALLDPDPRIAATKYEMLRRKLVRFFDWRECPFSEEGADETINRIGRKLEEGEVIHNVSSYAYGVARLVLLETRRKVDQDRIALSTAQLLGPEATAESDKAWSACFEKCLNELEPEHRNLLLDYYRGDGRARIEGRKAVAKALAITVGTLRIRAHRARLKLEACVEKCASKTEGEEVRESRLPTL